MAYDPSTFDESRLRRYARHVAEARAQTPTSQILERVHESETVRRWLGSKKVTRTVTRPVSAGGWILLVDPREGWKYCAQDPGHAIRIQGFEEGRLLLLTTGGELTSAEYQIHEHSSSEGGSWESHQMGTPLSASCDLLEFDRLNRAGYRDRDKPNKRNREVWRAELGRNWRIRVPHAGMEVSLALKRFKEGEEYISQLAIKY